MNAKLVLVNALEIFPLKNMGPDFKGTHCFTLLEGRMCLNLWYKGKVWPVMLDNTEEKKLCSKEEVILLLNDVKVEIDKRIQP